MRVYACKQLQVQTSPRSIHKPSGISQFWDFLSVFSLGSMVSGQREGQIITEYLAVLVESRIKCETTHTSPDILTEKGLTPWTKANMKINQQSPIKVLKLPPPPPPRIGPILNVDYVNQFYSCQIFTNINARTIIRP